MAGCLLRRNKLSIFFFSNIVLDASPMLHYDKLKLGEVPPGCAWVAFKIKSTPLRMKCYIYFHTISRNLPSTKKKLQIYNVSRHNLFLFYCGWEADPSVCFHDRIRGLSEDVWCRGKGFHCELWEPSTQRDECGYESRHPATVVKPLMCLLQQTIISFIIEIRSYNRSPNPHFNLF